MPVILAPLFALLLAPLLASFVLTLFVVAVASLDIDVTIVTFMPVAPCADRRIEQGEK